MPIAVGTKTTLVTGRLTDLFSIFIECFLTVELVFLVNEGKWIAKAECAVFMVYQIKRSTFFIEFFNYAFIIHDHISMP